MVKVIFSEGESTIHVRLTDKETLPDGTVFEPHESRVLLPGEMITLDEVPDYVLDLVKKGEAPGLVLIDESKAKALIEQANIVKGITPVNYETTSEVVETQETDLVASDF